MDAAEAELVRASMRHLVAEPSAAGLAAQLIESGWGELLESDTEVAVTSLAEELGRAAVAGPVLELVLLHGLGLGLGSSTGVVLPPLSRADADGLPARTVGDELVVDGLVIGGMHRARVYLVATQEGVAPVDAAALTFRPTGAGDPSLAVESVSGRPARSAPVASISQWQSAITLGRRALAAELIGLAERMLDDTLTYVVQREQFGRPIGSFQSVKHRLADVRVAAVAARCGLATAWSDGTAISAMAALCLAARAQQLAATHCHQVHGGIAFTVEHGFHRFIRRGQLISGLLGHPDDLTRRIGEHLIADRHVPRTPRLT